MLCVHNTDKPYYCETCKEFFKIKTEYQEHVEKTHPDDIPEDLQGTPTITQKADKLGKLINFFMKSFLSW